MSVQIRRITRENLTGLMPELLRLEHNWTGIGETAWAKENFEMDLPGKWDLTLYALSDGLIAGYAICSVDNNIGKLNKLVVDESFRNQGIASKLWDSFRIKCREKGLSRIEFKVLADNNAAKEFYRKKGLIPFETSIGDDGKLRYSLRYMLKMPERISHSKPTIDEKDEEAVALSVRNGDIATGRVVKQFVSGLSDYIGRKYAILTNSGSTALFLSLRALGIKQGDEVILPTYVCISVLNAVLQCRARPILADINSDDYNISFEDAKRKLTKRTKAIILPHMFGQPIKDIGQFIELNVPIIEDCAQAIGAYHSGKRVGSFGHVAIFSFYATKMMTSGVGGAILTDDIKIMKKLQDLMKTDGRLSLGQNYSFRMSDMQAALALSQLKKLDRFVSRRKTIAAKYSRILCSMKPDFKLPANKESIFFRYIIEHPDSKKILKNVRSRGVDAERPVFKPLHSYLKIPNSSFPNAAKAYARSVSIPIYPSLSDTQADEVATIMATWDKEKQRGDRK
jgi:perosamine synthetase